MNNHNFIDPLAVKQRIEIKHWYKVTTICFALLVLGLTYISMQQLWRLHIIKKQETLHTSKQTALQKVQTECAQLEAANSALKTKLNKIYKTTGQRANNAMHLQAIAQLLPNDLRINACTLTKNHSITLQAEALCSRSLTTFMQKMNSAPWCESVTIQSLTPNHSYETPCISFVVRVMMKN